MHVSSSQQRRFQTRWEPGHIPVSLRFVCWRRLMLSRQRPRWKDLMMLRSLGGHPILGRILKRPSPLTRSKAFVKSMKARKSGCLCSLHLSWSCLSEKIMSTVDLLARKPHCDSGQTCSASTWSLFSTTRAKTSQRRWGGICRDNYCNRLCRLCLPTGQAVTKQTHNHFLKPEVDHLLHPSRRFQCCGTFGSLECL